jgi:hypothetical protein
MVRYESDIEKLEDRIKNVLSDSSLSRLNQSVAKGVEGMMKNRIHVKGKDADERPLKSYTREYAKQRRKKGLQTVPVNFRVSGKLQNSLVTKKGPGNSWVIEFNNPKSEAIAEGLQVKRPNVWEMSQNEIDYAVNRFAEELAILLK